MESFRISSELGVAREHLAEHEHIPRPSCRTGVARGGRFPWCATFRAVHSWRLRRSRHATVSLRLNVGSLTADTTLIVNDRFITSVRWEPILAAIATNSSTRSVRGVVVDSTNRPLADVHISVRGFETKSTDLLGRFRIQLPAHQSVVLDVRRLGFMPVQYSLSGGDDTALVIRMMPVVQQLAKVNVTDRAVGSARLQGFEERLNSRRHATTGGFFITAEDIERRKPDLTTSLFTEIPAMRVVRIGMTEYGVFGISRDSRGGTPCPATIFLDGQRLTDVSVNSIIQPLDIAGIEVYPSANAAPTQYQSLNGGCAVVLIWTKAG
jgi:Carboxypeptidase regulatory-like domain